MKRFKISDSTSFPSLKTPLFPWFYQSNFISSIWKVKEDPLLLSWSRAYVNSTLFSPLPLAGAIHRALIKDEGMSRDRLLACFLAALKKYIYIRCSQTSRPCFTCIIKLCHVADLDCKTLFRKREFMSIVGKLVSLLVFKTVCYITDIRSKFFLSSPSLQVRRKGIVINWLSSWVFWNFDN